MSYANVILYGASLPSYRKKDKNDKGQKHEFIKADDPKNRDKVHELIASFK